MPELPEIYCRAKEMNQSLPSKQILSIEIIQPKCLNLTPDVFSSALSNAVIEEVPYHGKWIKTKTTAGWLLINLGMGGEILLTLRENIPDNYRLVIDFTDKTCLVIHYWWFGYAYYAPLNRLDSIPMVARLGPNVIDLSREDFSSLLRNQNPKTRVIAFLLDQSKVAGIGNAYIHNILFLAGLHPLRTISSMAEKEINHLYLAILAGLKPSLEKGGTVYEFNLCGEKGGFKVEDILIGYKAGSLCPRCGTLIEKNSHRQYKLIYLSRLPVP